jgi:hypothetical protein
MTEAEDQRREWNKTSEADIPQAEAKHNHIANAKTIRRADLSTCRKVDTKVSQEADPKPTANKLSVVRIRLAH